MRPFLTSIVLALFALQDSAQTSSGPIQHIVFIIKENRTFDNYFGTYPGSNGATTGYAGSELVKLQHAPLQMPSDICHTWACSHTAINKGKMNGFNSIPKAGLAPYVRLWRSDIPNYWKIAEKFVLADHAFSSLSGPSFPNHILFRCWL